MRARRIALATASAVLLGGVYVSSATASPPSAPPPQPGQQWAGILDDSGRKKLRIRQDDVELRVKGRTEVRVFDLTYPPGSFSGWHTHPGIVIVVVKEGTVIRQSGCESEEFTVGEAFYEVGPHNVMNTGDKKAVLAITRILPLQDPPLPGRHEASAPDC